MGERLGQALVKESIITREQLEEALKAQVIFGGQLGTNLVELGFIDEDALAYFLSEKLNFPYASAEQLDSIDEAVIRLIPREMAERYQAVPVSLSDTTLRVLMYDPTDVHAIDNISEYTGRSVLPLVAPEMRVIAALEKYYKVPRDVRYLTYSKHKEDPLLMTDTQIRDVVKPLEPGTPAARPAGEVGETTATASAAVGSVFDDDKYLRSMRMVKEMLGFVLVDLSELDKKIKNSIQDVAQIKKQVETLEKEHKRKQKEVIHFAAPETCPTAPAEAESLAVAETAPDAEPAAVARETAPPLAAPTDEPDEETLSLAASFINDEEIAVKTAEPPRVNETEPTPTDDAPEPAPPQEAESAPAEAAPEKEVEPILGEATVEPDEEPTQPKAKTPETGFIDEEAYREAAMAEAKPAEAFQVVDNLTLDDSPACRPSLSADVSEDEESEEDESPELDLCDDAEESLEQADEASKSDVIGSLYEASKRLENVSDRAEITEIVLNFSTYYTRRAAMFILKKHMIQGWDGRGENLSSDMLERIKIPSSVPSIFKTVIDNGQPYLGPMPDQPVNEKFLSVMGGLRPANVFILPIYVREKLIAFLYADNGEKQTISKESIEDLFLLDQRIAAAFEQLIHRQKAEFMK